MLESLDALNCSISGGVSSVYPNMLFSWLTPWGSRCTSYREGDALIPDMNVFTCSLNLSLSNLSRNLSQILTTSCATLPSIWNSAPKNIRPRCSELRCLLVMGSRWGLREMGPNRRNLVPWRYHWKEMLGGLSLPASLCLVNIANLTFCHAYHSDTLPQYGLRHNEELTSD